MRVLYVFGTRPEFIRSTPIIHELQARAQVDLALIHTGQHYDHNMSGGFLNDLGLPVPNESLGCGARSRVEQITCVASGTASAIERLRPTCACVFGDTNSSLGGALAAIATDIPLVHIEAGARSYDLTMPEEQNRRLIDHASDLLLAVSQNCAANLSRESVPGAVIDVGDPLYEVFCQNMSSLVSDTPPDGGTCLMTLHRQGLVDRPADLIEVLQSVADFAERNDLHVEFPAHPRTSAVLAAHLPRGFERILLRPPVMYRELLQLLSACSIVITDSGGLQKEAFWAGKPCVTVRANTEWVETILAGANVLALGDRVGSAAEAMLKSGLTLTDPWPDPYHGRGATSRIVDAIIQRYAR